eukprot:Seg492.6 transcript_id=Seg492.6/GoldUCD/mRNA.D3Y31 product="Protein MEMO1" protein_id=Seg492.6/GoldUCD/D3Y31
MAKRQASHAGTWYKSEKGALRSQLESWLSKAQHEGPAARAIISPHAGYAYCGSCAAHAYKQIDPRKIKRVFILGPSHHYGLPGCALTAAVTYETPLYNLKIDVEVNQKLLETGQFEVMSSKTDEDEHSIEMQLPYIAKVMESRKDSFTVVPVLVGSTKKEREAAYGEIFYKYLMDPENLFVISSDFCHWGRRFRYIYYDKSHGKIHQSIEKLDKMGMALIEKLDATGFNQYLKDYSNTICGRHPIGIFLNAVEVAKRERPEDDYRFKFLSYSQSGACIDMTDSSVSYAAGALTV